MQTDETISRWESFLAKIRERAQETLLQAEQGCSMLLDLNNLDTLPMSNAWTAIELQLLDLGSKVEATWNDKVEPALEAAESASDRISIERDKGKRLTQQLERDREALSIRIFAEAARKILEEAKANLAKEFRCTQCRAAIPISKQFFRSAHVACAYCKTVNTFIPGTQVQAVEHFCCHHLAREKTRDLYFAWLDAEAAMKANDEDMTILKAAETALLDYTVAYLRARIETVPEHEKDFDKDLKGKTQFFYQDLNHNRVWPRSP